MEEQKSIVVQLTKEENQMLLNDLIKQLQDLQAEGHGEKDVKFLDEHNCEVEIYEIDFNSDSDETIYLSCAKEEEEEEEEETEEEKVEEEKK